MRIALIGITGHADVYPYCFKATIHPDGVEAISRLNKLLRKTIHPDYVSYIYSDIPVLIARIPSSLSLYFIVEYFESLDYKVIIDVHIKGFSKYYLGCPKDRPIEDKSIVEGYNPFSEAENRGR